MKHDFELLPHTADIKLRVTGSSQAELFRHAVQGMFTIMQPRAQGCVLTEHRIVCAKLDSTRSFDIRADAVDELLVAFLSNALFYSDVHNEAYFDAAIDSIDEHSIRGVFKGVGIQGFDRPEIKAVTYHELSVTHNHDQWTAEIVFDV